MAFEGHKEGDMGLRMFNSGKRALELRKRPEGPWWLEKVEEMDSEPRWDDDYKFAHRWEYRWIDWNPWCRDGLYCCDCLSADGQLGSHEDVPEEGPVSVFGLALERAVVEMLCGRAA